MDISIIIPCLNEAVTIERAINSAKLAISASELECEVIVVDNGSSDTSSEIAKGTGVRIVDVPKKGYGIAIHSAIYSAKGQWVFLGDADLSYDFCELRKFTPYMRDDLEFKYDVILGSRFNGDMELHAMPFIHRYIGTPFLNCLLYALFGLKSSDCNSGMRAIRKAFYVTLGNCADGMEWASDNLARTALAKGKYVEIPIQYYKDQRNCKSHLRTWRDGFRNLANLLRLFKKKWVAPSLQLAMQ